MVNDEIAANCDNRDMVKFPNRLRDFRLAAGLSQPDLARAADTNVQNVSRIERGDRKLTPEWAARFAPALNTSPQELIFPEQRSRRAERMAPLANGDLSPSELPLRPAYRAGTVEAGAWREVDMFDQSEMQWLALPPDPQFPQATQEIYDVSGDSMNALEPFPILPGSQVVALRYDDIAGRVPLRDKMVVVVERARDAGHTRELSIKQVEFYEDRIEFHPRSTNPKHKPIVVEHDSWADEGTTVAVRALVRRTMNELPL